MQFGATSATNRQIQRQAMDLMWQWHFSYCHIFLLNRLDVLLGTGFSVAVVGATNVAVTPTRMCFYIRSVFYTVWWNIHHSFLYVISRTIQNASFNTPYDVTTRIKSWIRKIMRFSLKSSLYTIFWCYTAILKNNPYSFPGRDFLVYLLSWPLVAM